MGLLRLFGAPKTVGHVALNGETIAYAVERSARRRRTYGIYLTASGDIRIVIPSRAPLRSVEATIYKCQRWIIRQRAKRTSRHAMIDIETIKEGDTFSYLGAPVRLALQIDASLPQGCVLLGDRLSVILPPTAECERTHALRLEVALWLKRQAKKVLSERMDFWSEKLSIRYNRLSITSPRSRWGSCSAKNDIRLNWRVILRDLDLIDYLIVHELCHVKQKNHSARFWHLVEDALPDYKERRKELRSVM